MSSVRSLTNLGGAVETHQHQLVLARTHDALYEPNRGLLLEAELIANTVAGVDQNGQTQRQIGFRGELLNDLRLFVLDDSKSFLVRSVMKRPFLSVTVNRMLTRVTSRTMRVSLPST